MHISLLIMMAFEKKRFWFAEPVYDFELKQYEFLSMIQKYREAYENFKIHPWYERFQQLRSDIQTYISDKKRSDLLRRNDLTGVDFTDNQLLYSWQPDMVELKEVNTLIAYVNPIVDESLHDLQQLRKHVENRIHCEPIGLFSSRPESGFVLMNHTSGVHAYTYWKDLVYHKPGVTLSYIDVFKSSQVAEVARLKKDLNQMYPNVSSLTWYVTGGEEFPLSETLQPIVSEIIYELV